MHRLLALGATVSQPPILRPRRRMDHILLAADMRVCSEQLFAHGLVLAMASGATLHLVHVHAPGEAPRWEAMPSVREVLHRWGILDASAPVDAFRALGFQVRAEAVAARDPAEVIVHLAEERVPDLLLLGTRGRQGLRRLLHGSVGERIARGAGLPTLFIPAGVRGLVDLVEGHLRLSRLLLPVGGRVPVQRAVDLAASTLELLARDRAEIVVVHVGDDPVDGVVLPARDGWTWRTDLRRGAVVPAILDAVAEHTPDLVVMATCGGRGLLSALVGTRTERVLHEARCPVLSVPVEAAAEEGGEGGGCAGPGGGGSSGSGAVG